MMNVAERTLQLKTDIDGVYEAGKKAEYNEFWDRFQNYGKREYYKHAFFQWRHEYIRPKYKVCPDNRVYNYIVDSMFESCEKLKVIEKEYFDFSNYTPINNTASGCWLLTYSNCKSLEIFYDVGMKAGGYSNTWRYNQKLRKIEVMRCCQAGGYASPFHGCTELTEIRTEGEIGKSFPIPQSPLSKESLKSIITCLHDYSGSAYAFNFTVTFKASAFAKLEKEGATAEYNGEACTWAELIDNKKWNLVKA